MRWRRPVGKSRTNGRGYVIAHLFCRRRNPRDRLAIPAHARQISRDEDLRVAGKTEIRCNDHPTGTIRRHTEQRAERRCGDTGRPDHGSCRDELRPETIARRRDVGDQPARHDIDSEAFELPARFG